MRRHALPLLALALLAGCGAGGGSGGGSGAAVVAGVGPDDFLRLRAGPGLGYGIVLGLPDGTALRRRDCVTELGQLWCRVSLAAAPQITGYAIADHLAAP